MNKYLMMSAAAALATTAAGSADAGTFSVHFGSSGGGSYCEGLKGGNNGYVYAGTFVVTTCGYSHNEQAFGIGGKTKGDPVGKNHVFFPVGPTIDFPSEYIAFDIETPIKAGNKWDFYTCFAGGSCSLVNRGVLKAGAPAKNAPSVTAKLADIIRQHALKTN